MVDWEKVEKVTDGIERHTVNVLGESFSTCSGCPYDDVNTVDCAGKLAQDALAVIAQLTATCKDWEKFRAFLAIHNAL